jgi:hypothetical protein
MPPYSERQELTEFLRGATNEGYEGLTCSIQWNSDLYNPPYQDLVRDVEK